MKITILCVGKIKEKFYRDAIAEYSKRLSRYCKLDIIEVADEKTPENASDTVENQIREKKQSVSWRVSIKKQKRVHISLPLQSMVRS